MQTASDSETEDIGDMEKFNVELQELRQEQEQHDSQSSSNNSIHSQNFPLTTFSNSNNNSTLLPSGQKGLTSPNNPTSNHPLAPLTGIQSLFSHYSTNAESS
ncbi:MAG: hypothetical protein EXX96DRAFT_537698 [Benjaminiella poitrasii]|nr:MAG: hypothetical protein EXX96DRAFT_537698 [Benjaminiella poitrasii]